TESLCKHLDRRDLKPLVLLVHNLSRAPLCTSLPFAVRAFFLTTEATEVHGEKPGPIMKKMIQLVLLCFTFAMVVEAQTSKPTTVAEAEEFMKNAESRLAELDAKVNQAQWVHENFITDDTEALAAAANDQKTALTSELVEQAKRFD